MIVVMRRLPAFSPFFYHTESLPVCGMARIFLSIFFSFSLPQHSLTLHARFFQFEIINFWYSCFVLWKIEFNFSSIFTFHRQLNNTFLYRQIDEKSLSFFLIILLFSDAFSFAFVSLQIFLFCILIFSFFQFLFWIGRSWWRYFNITH